ncbi:MAG: hypothetical protein WC612_04820 [Bdellovibrionales bacterium]|jgi:hypothetical protein
MHNRQCGVSEDQDDGSVIIPSLLRSTSNGFGAVCVGGSSNLGTGEQKQLAGSRPSMQKRRLMRRAKHRKGKLLYMFG